MLLLIFSYTCVGDADPGHVLCDYIFGGGIWTMHAEPIHERLNVALEEHGEQIIELIGCGWTDRCIANYLGKVDHMTIRRIRKRFYSNGLDVLDLRFDPGLISAN